MHAGSTKYFRREFLIVQCCEHSRVLDCWTEANAARSAHMVGSWVSTLTTASATAAMRAKCPARRVKGCCTAKQSLGVASQKSVLY